MFSHANLETINNRVIIVDSDYETMQELLRFIYCEKILDMKKVALTLLPAADKVIEFLKISYNQLIISKISVQFDEVERDLRDFLGK
jgi:hypothetical protein